MMLLFLIATLRIITAASKLELTAKVVEAEIDKCTAIVTGSIINKTIFPLVNNILNK